MQPPVAPMLARLERELPRGDYLYEPKWDGFRCLAFCDGESVDLRSRHDRPLARYFPEVVDGLRRAVSTPLVLDGEIMLIGPGGFDFATLLSRLHPAASRVEMMSARDPAQYVAFDVLAAGRDDLRARPFVERRRALERLVCPVPSRATVTPATDDPDLAQRWLDRFAGGGVDGVMAKARTLDYQPGRRAMVKVKHERTIDCVVAGFRVFLDRPALSSLILALYDDAGELRHVGVATGFGEAQRRELVARLGPLVVPLEAHPWVAGFGIERSPIGRLKGAAGRWTPDMPHDWVPVRPELVCEVAATAIDFDRFRHPARFRRWRPDREPTSCTIHQLDVDATTVEDVLGRPA